MIRTIGCWCFSGKTSIGRIGSLMAAGLLVFGTASCGRSKNESKAEESVETNAERPSPPAEKSGISEKTEPAIPPLPASILQGIGKMGAVVQIPGQPNRLGILVEGPRSQSSGRNYLVICDVPPGVDSVGIVCQGSGKLAKTFGKRVSILPSGLSLFGFSSASSLTCAQVREPVAGETFHAIDLTSSGALPVEEEAALKAELDSVTTQMNDLQRSRSENMRQMGQPYRPGRDPRNGGQDPRLRAEAMRKDVYSYQEKTAELSKRRSELNALLKIQVSSISPVEVAAGTSAPEVPARELSHTLLGTSAGSLTAIRFQGKWIGLKEIIEASADQVDRVKIDLSGHSNQLSLTCHLSPTFPSADSSWSLLAVTTYELESQGSGSLEDRLALATRTPFKGGSRDLSVSLQPEWNGRPTKLWLRIFNDKEPEKPLIDEVVLLDYPGRFSARWAKPPSPLIQLPETEPNTPENLVEKQLKLDVKGQIRDIIAAGDGSVVMVQTIQPPYWAALDMKSGEWLETGWKATADTLAATQAGKIYLIDRRTKVVEIWALASGKREGLQLLQLEGPVTAVAAPLTDATQPIMITTENNGYFLDPVTFEVIPSGLDLRRFFNAAAGKRYGQSPLNPASICLRASGDGSLYQFSGSSDGPNRNAPSSLTCTVDRSATVVSTANDRQFLGTRGRNTSRGIPDHGGSAVILSPASSGGQFPGTVGEIRFMDAEGRNTLATLKNPPVLPEGSEQQYNKRTNDYPVADRTAYLDLSAGVLLLPDADTLHLVRLNLPEQEKLPPKFLFAGEVFKLPLPAGTGHKLVSEGGTSEIVSDSISWTAPVATDRDREFNLKMEWTGELGSPISKDYRIQVMQPSLSPEVASPDGLRKIPLRRRTFLSDLDSSIDGFAGSGTVALVSENKTFSAWNLVTGEMILSVTKDHQRLLGDADRIYALDRNGGLTSYDIQTGNPLGQASLGSKIQSIATGMSCRDSVLAVEQEGVEAYLMQIHRDSLKTVIMDLPQETRRNLFIPQMRANASGSAIWSRLTGIFRDSRAITVKPFSHEVLGRLSDGVPDQSGQFLVGLRTIVNIGANPPKVVEISSLPGATNSTSCKLEESGRYILLWGSGDESQTGTISVRDVKEPSKELLKIRCSRDNSSGMTQVISGSNTLIQSEPTSGNRRLAIYEFDIPELIQQLSR